MIFDALIIGGGPAGATTALLLAEAGWTVAIVEKKCFPRRKVCGEFLSATNLPLLQKLKLADFYLASCGPEVQRVGLYASDTILTSNMPRGDCSRGNGRAIGREHLDSRLLERAVSAGATLWQPFTAKTLQQKENLFTVTISAQEKVDVIKARLVVIANGSRERQITESSTRTHKPSDLLAFKAHFRHSLLPSDLMPLLAFPGGYGGLVHSDNERVTLSCCIRRDVLQRIRYQQPGIAAAEAVFNYIIATCRGVREVMVGAKREGNWLAAGPIRPGIRPRYAKGLFFVGNSAGEAHPIVAEGISMAMQSAWVLSEILIAHKNKLTEDGTFANAGALYSKQWSKHFATRIHAAALFAQLAMRPWSQALILSVIKRFPRLLTAGAKLSGKIQQIVPLE
jgi:menaquinone-9 beta-reductase